MKLINQVKKHGKAVTLHLKRHHKKYIFGILSVSLFVKGISLIVAHTLVHNLSFANILTGDDTDSIINAEFDDNELTENLDGLTDGSDTKINSENIEGGNLEEPENSTDPEEPIVDENPEDPGNSTDLEEPIVSEDPEEPGNSTDLEEPIVSEDPEEPTVIENQVEPEDPEEPAVTENLVEPEDPEEPEEPAVTENQVESEEPEEPEEPTITENSVEPEEPEKPAVTENQVELKEPEEPAVSKTRGVSEEVEEVDLDEDDEDYVGEDDEDYPEEYDEENEDITAKEIDYQTWITGDLTTFEKAIQEVAYAYYMRGPKIQYNTKKANYAYFSPEEATIQNFNYLVCAAFTKNVYYDLGIKIPEYVDRLLIYTTGHLGSPEVVGYGTKSGSDFIMRIYDSNEEGHYRILTNPELEDIIPFLRIGDILTYNGHTLMVYDLDYGETGNVVDAILMQSAHGGGKGYVKTKLSGKTTIGNISFGSANQFLYHNSTGSAMYPDFAEGSLNLISIKDETYWKEIGTAKGKRNYSILRFVQENESGEAVVRLRYSGYTGGSFLLSNKTQDRLKFNKLFIEKTVSEHADDVVEPGSTMIYTIFIKNNSTGNYTDDLIITEDISEFVSYKSYTGSKNVKDFDENGLILTWNIGKLNAGEEFTIQYSVDIDKGNIGDVVISTGYVGYIPSAVIKNKIGKNLNKEQENKIKNSFESLKSDGYHGKELIDEIYKQSLGVDLNFTEFGITGLITNQKIDGVSNQSYYTININSKNSFSGMILNKYWSTLVVNEHDYSGTVIYEYNLKNWRPFSSGTRRADTIYPENFRTGDILIYTNKNDYTYSGLTTKPVTYESGEYAYIFIDGKFKGVNLGSDGISGTLDDRNEFTTGYYKTGGRNLSWYSAYLINQSMEFQSDEYIKPLPYQTLFGKDYYVILRPSLMIRNISYELNGGTNNIDNPSVFILGKGVELKNPTKTGFTFYGWYTDSGYTHRVYNNRDFTDDVTLYAKWDLSTFEKAFQEVAYAYYMRGPYVHYNSAKGRGHDFSPEESTSQDYNYLACGLYVLNVYRQLLGHLSGNVITFPYDGGQRSYAKAYVGKRPEVIGYGEKSGGNLYWWNGTTIYASGHNIENPDKSYIISQLKIGDILGYEGHVTMVYDYKYNESGDIEDVYLIHATDKPNYRVYSKLNLGETVQDKSGNVYELSIGHNKWSAIRYNHFDRTTQSDHHPDARVEGTVQIQMMSDANSVLKFNTNNYSSHYYILRFVNTDDSGNSVLSIEGRYGGYQECSGCTYYYSGKKINYSDSVQSRLKYSKLYIEKTVNKWDNSIVGVGDELTYTIRIQNNSDKVYDHDLIVIENINIDLVENLGLYSYTKNGVQANEIQLLNNGDQLQWNIGQLNSGDELIIEYTVKVRPGNVGETIESTGMVGGIPSGILTNTIGRNTDKGENLKQSYNELKGIYTGKMLINEVYKAVYGADLGIDKIVKINTTDQSDTGALIYYNNKWGSRTTNWDDVKMRINRKSPYSGMVLNGYFNVLYKNINDARAVNKSGDEISITRYGFPAIAVKSNDIDKRADTIFPSNFMTGDILIYKNSNDVYYNRSSNGYAYVSVTNTYENGEYAYIYIDGKFVGVNLGTDLTGTKDDRNEFTINYYNGRSIYTTGGSPTPVSQIDMIGGFKNWLHYQTLFLKDAYVVLRPSLMIRSIDYELDGGINDDQNPRAFILRRDVELIEPTKTGYVFSGWYTDSEYTNQVTNTRDLTDDVVLYAKWMSNCTFQGINIIHGNSLTVYSAGSTTCPATCITGTVTCNNGTVLGNTEYSNLSCSPLPVPCDMDFTLTSTGSHGIYESCIPYTVSNNSCTPGITVYKLTDCASGYHTENSTSCISNTKMVSCTQDGKPDNSSYKIENVQVRWNGTWNNGSWSTADNCSWICNTGYTQVGNGCRHELTTFEKAFQEVAYAYYMRGPYMHYNAAKSMSDILPPEESTSQDYHYMTCTPYVMNVYKELLGIVLTSADEQYGTYARDYVGIRPEVIGYGEKSGANLYWWDGTTQYSEFPQRVNPDQSYIISQLKIGDILYYAGHTMLVYDYVYSGNDIVDVYLLHSWQANYVTRTKADHSNKEKYYNENGQEVGLKLGNSQRSRLGYNYRDRIGIYPGLSRVEGTVILERLREHKYLTFTQPYESKYSILRLVTTNSSGEDLLNFNGQWTGGDQYNTKKFLYYGFLALGTGPDTLYESDNSLKTFNNQIINNYSDSVQSRLKYSKLYIEKTVDKKDNNIVEPDDELTYKIMIKNESNKNYEDNLVVRENIDTNLVEYLSRTSTSDIQLIPNNENQLQRNIGKLDSGNEVKIEYTVKVKTGHIGETIESTGLVDNIPSGIVKNKIGKNTDKGEELKESFNNLSDNYTGKILINKIYGEVYGVDLGLNGLIMTGYINRNGTIIEGQSGLIFYTKTGNAGWNPKIHNYMYINPEHPFSGMVLNNYFNALRRERYSAIGDTKITLYEVPTLLPYKNPDNRANTIYPTDFKTGDILIYINENDVKYTTGLNSSGDKINKEIPITYEDGEYAYIYIDGKFMGVNLGNDGVKDQKTGGDDRNEFGTVEYHVVNKVDSYKRELLLSGEYRETENSGCRKEIHESYCIKIPNDELKEFLRYQTLFGKDAYVVLRPSLMIRDITYELDGGTNNDENSNAFILGRDAELKEPTKTGYVFGGWYTDSEYTTQVTNTNELTDDIVLYAKWENTYTVTWKNRDGTILETDEDVEYGSSPEYNGSIPTRTGDVQYSYTFAGWSPATGVVQGDQTYTAQYTTSTNEYLITFKNYDDSILETSMIPYGDTPYYDGETPKKEPDQQYYYVFSEWTPEIVPVIGTATYTAQFNTVGTNEYTITLIVSPTGYGDFSQYSVTAIYGSNIIFDGNTLIVSGTTVTATPRSNPKYTYSFSGRINSCGDILTHNCTITGDFTRFTNTYTVTWKNRDGTVLETDEDVEYGSSPEYNGSIPTRTGDAQYSYTFYGWSPTTGVVQGDQTYTAEYTTSINEYLITFKNYDGSILETGMVVYGETPTYNGNTPSKEGGYEFSGWNPTIHPVNGIQVYTAMFRDIQGPTGEIIVSYLSGYLTNGCTSGNITLNLTGSDINGLATEPYKRNEGLWTTNPEKIVTSNTQGTGYIKDVAGNVTPIPYNITGISKTGLVISLDSPENGSILTGFVKLERAASIINPTCQALSGGYNIIVYSGTEEVYTGNTVSTSIDSTFQDGTYTWKVYANDILGHRSTSETWTFIIDKQAPTCDIDYTPAESLGWTSGDVQSILTGCSQGTTGFNVTGHLFTGNGTYEFTFRNEQGLTGNKIAHVRRIDKIPPYLQEVTPIGTTTDTTPNYTFSSTESGSITYSGVCRSTTTQAISGNNTITLNALAVGTYSGCTITVTDRAGNISNVLNISEFKIKQSGGGGSTLKRDKCPGGDFSDSYYDGICENNRKNTHNAPNTDNGSPYQRGDEFIYDKQIFDAKYSDEMNQAYQFAYYYGITTKNSISAADMNGSLTRVAMAKMLSQYAINVLGKEPDNTRQNTFVDVSSKLDSDYSSGVTLAYQLGIMGINMKDNKFRPYDTVSRAEFVTALSRLLYGIEDGKDNYYSTHMNLLKYLGIITNTDPTMKELRGYVMLMLMRSAK